MKVFYRISDGSYKHKVKLDNATKKRCLFNFLENWIQEEVTILADKIEPETKEFLELYRDTAGLDVQFIQGGSSAQSFRIAYEKALELPDDEKLYLVEDDYFHLDFSRRCLLEALEIADYVTLYDAPDKYRTKTGGAGVCPYVNPLVAEGGEHTQVVITDSSHWKLTNSTTCTFASSVKVLREDYPIWQRHCFSSPGQMHPHDFQCFLELRENGRTLLSPIPTLSTHAETEWLAPLTDWTKI